MIENTWLEIALYPGCIQGFFLAYLLQRKKQSNREAVRYFNALLLTLSILMLLRVSYQPSFFKTFAEIILLPDVILFLAGPFIFLFTRALLRLEPQPKRIRLLHFVPAMIHVSVVNTFLGLHLKGILTYLSMRQVFIGFLWIEAAAMLSLGIYLCLSLHTYYRYREAFFEKYAAPFLGRFLRVFFVAGLVLLTFWMAGFAYKLNHAQNDYHIYTLFWVLLVAAIYLLAFKILTTPSILELPKLLDNKQPDYDSLSPSALQELEQYMAREKPYLNPEIKIGELADELDLPKHQLSRLINLGFGKNFFDFVNGYRVREFIRLRQEDGSVSYNTLELAFQSGFNSKSAFNRAFRKEIGKSPRDYFTAKGNPSTLSN